MAVLFLTVDGLLKYGKQPKEVVGVAVGSNGRGKETAMGRWRR